MRGQKRRAGHPPRPKGPTPHLLLASVFPVTWAAGRRLWTPLDGQFLVGFGRNPLSAAPASSSDGRFGKGPLGSPREGGQRLRRFCKGPSCGCIAVEQAYFAERGTQVFLTDPECENDHPPPNTLLLGPTCHKKSTTLVCLAQGFFYEWPLDVIWKRDGQEVSGLAVATEKAKAQGKCRFDIASRLRVAAEEWREGHTYSCHVSQGDAKAEASYTHEWSQQQNFGLSDVSQSLQIGQLVFLLLAIKSFAYGTVLGIYTVYRKKKSLMGY